MINNRMLSLAQTMKKTTGRSKNWNVAIANLWGFLDISGTLTTFCAHLQRKGSCRHTCFFFFFFLLISIERAADIWVVHSVLHAVHLEQSTVGRNNRQKQTGGKSTEPISCLSSLELFFPTLRWVKFYQILMEKVSELLTAAKLMLFCCCCSYMLYEILVWSLFRWVWNIVFPRKKKKKYLFFLWISPAV